MLKKKQKLFIQYYTDLTDKKVYHNGTQAAIKAGYSERRASSQACHLLKYPEISQQIAVIEKEQARQWDITKEEAIKEARRNYEQATKHTERRYWYDTWLKLNGWDIQKQEITQESNISLTSDQINTALREARLSTN